MPTSFRHEDAFPMIARVIITASSREDIYLDHGRIVAAVIADPFGSKLAAGAQETAKWATVEQAAANMVAWFSQQITIGKSPWIAFFDRKRIKGTWAYRPKTSAPPHIAEDIELSVIEGEPRLFFHLKRERNPKLRQAKIDSLRAAGTEPCCEACGLITRIAFPGLMTEILEAHHRMPLSSYLGEVTTTLSDIALLCPNCHRALHRTKPFLSIEDFRQVFSFSSAESAGSAASKKILSAVTELTGQKPQKNSKF